MSTSPEKPEDLPGDPGAVGEPVAQSPIRRATMSRRSIVINAIGAIAALTILGLLLYRERDALAGIELTRSWPRLLAGQLLILLTLVIAALVWAGIMGALGSRAALRDHVHIYASTHLARYLPGTVWYIVGRSSLYQLQGDTARMVSIGSAIELLLSTMAAALLAIGLGLRNASQAPDATIPALALFVGVSAVALHPRVIAWLAARLRMPPLPPLRLRSLVKWLLSDAINWILGGLVLWLVANEIGGVPPAQFAYTTFAWTLVGVLSVMVYFLPSNFGLTEVGLSLLLSRVMPSSLAVVVAVLTRVLMTIFTALACGMIVAVTHYWRR